MDALDVATALLVVEAAVALDDASPAPPALDAVLLAASLADALLVSTLLAALLEDAEALVFVELLADVPLVAPPAPPLPVSESHPAKTPSTANVVVTKRERRIMRI